MVNGMSKAVNQLILLSLMKVFLWSSLRDIENSLSKMSRTASSFSIRSSLRSISSPIFDHCYEDNVSASSGVTTNLNVTKCLSVSSNRLVKDYFLSPDLKAYSPSSNL